MADQDFELEVWDNGKPFNKNNEVLNKIKVLKEKKDYKGILELANTLQNNQETYLIKANANMGLQRWDDVIKCCDIGLDLGEQSEFWHLKGKAAGKLGKPDQKVEYIKNAIELNPKVATYYRNLGAGYYATKDYDQAINCHNKAIELEPHNAINYHNKGAAFLRSGRAEEALGCFEKALEIDDKLALSYSWRGDCYKALNQQQFALDSYDKAYKVSGNEVYLKEKRAL